MVFKVFQPSGVWDTLGSWLSILSFSGGPVLSQGQQSLGYGNATQVTLNGLRSLLFQLSGAEQIFHSLCAHPELALLSCAPCSLCAWGDRQRGRRAGKTWKQHCRENWEIFFSTEVSSSSAETFLLPSEQWQFMPRFSLVFQKRWLIKFIINNELC